MRQLPSTDPAFHAELFRSREPSIPIIPSGVTEEEHQDDHDMFNDSSDVPLIHLIQHLTGKKQNDYIEGENGSLQALSSELEASSNASALNEYEDTPEIHVKVGKRKRKVTQRYREYIGDSRWDEVPDKDDETDLNYKM